MSRQFWREVWSIMTRSHPAYRGRDVLAAAAGRTPSTGHRWPSDEPGGTLADAVRLAVNELDLEHRPTWASEAAEAAGKEPVGCAMCWPRDGRWPCISRQVCDDLRHALSGR